MHIMLVLVCLPVVVIKYLGDYFTGAGESYDQWSMSNHNNWINEIRQYHQTGPCQN